MKMICVACPSVFNSRFKTESVNVTVEISLKIKDDFLTAFFDHKTFLSVRPHRRCSILVTLDDLSFPCPLLR